MYTDELKESSKTCLNDSNRKTSEDERQNIEEALAKVNELASEQMRRKSFPT